MRTAMHNMAFIVSVITFVSVKEEEVLDTLFLYNFPPTNFSREILFALSTTEIFFGSLLSHAYNVSIIFHK